MMPSVTLGSRDIWYIRIITSWDSNLYKSDEYNNISGAYMDEGFIVHEEKSKLMNKSFRFHHLEEIIEMLFNEILGEPILDYKGKIY